MPKNLTPEDRWETDFQVPLPGEPRRIGPLEVLFQGLLNRTERLKNRIAAILGTDWDATPPDTLAGLAGRVRTLETGQGGTTLSAHRTTPVLDHPNGCVTTEKLANEAVTTPKIADGAVTIPKLANASADIIPNTIAIRNAQGALNDGAITSNFRVIKVGGIYEFVGTKWFLLATWSGFSGSYRGIFADLRIRKMSGSSSGTLRFRAIPGGTSEAFISVSNNTRYTLIHNAIVRETSDGVYELWILCSGDIYVEGVLGTITGQITLTPYGNASGSTQDTTPAEEPGRFYLEWNSVSVGQMFVGPGHIVSASRGITSGYIRYDNGIQVCWATITVGSGTWTYPAAFASTPQVLATAQDSAPRLVTITSVSTTAAGILRTDLSGTMQSGTVHLWAIGLWK